MHDLFYYVAYFSLLFLLELLYFRIAFVNKIIDKPNKRSSHTRPTIRGGGIIFPLSVSLWFILNQFNYPYFFSGLLIIAFISFLDDIRNLPGRVRSFFHLLCVGLLLYEMPGPVPFYWLIPCIIVIIGFINAYNFMDGINGITGICSLVTLSSLLYINQFIKSFTFDSLIIFLLLALLVFNFFNFRRIAKCFAGDVGSISMAFIISFLMIKAIVVTGNFLLIGFVFIYGLDSVSTIIFRLFRKENIFKAHRTHFYQFLSNEKQWPHLSVALLYSIIQLVFNLLIISSLTTMISGQLTFLILAAATIAFLLIRLKAEGYNKLLKSS